MKYIMIKFTAWRDGTGNAQADAAGTESAAATEKLAKLQTRDVELQAELTHIQGMQKISDSESVRDRLKEIAAEIDNLFAARKAARAALDAAGRDQHRAAKAHARSGSFGYQVVSDDGAVIEIVDDQGKPLPEGAVHENEVVDANPPTPRWAGGAA